jgi:uncharacterized repeat protein (TIGR02543 family)
MSIPYVAGAFRGWTKKRLCRIVTKQTVNFLIQQVAELVTLEIMISPLQPEEVRRKPEEQREWKWYSFLIKSSGRELTIDSQLIVDGLAYRVESRQPWSEAGYRRYHATEDYTGLSPMYAVRYDANGGEGNAGAVFAYQSGALVTVGANPFTRTGYTFTGWLDGSTPYAPGDVLTIGVVDVTLKAQWEVIP